MNFNCLPGDRICAEFDHDREAEAGTSLSHLCKQLLLRQQETWPTLKSGYDAVAQALVRTIDCDDFSVKLQFNPRRIVSSSAKVDSAAIAARPCFLCPANLPEAQLGILYRRQFLILCNPFPIFSNHFTISSLEHRPQAIEDNLDVFLHLARDLAPSFAVFYNGPQCGASAPDHLHFQACPVGSLPIETELEDNRPILPISRHLSASVYRVENLGRATLLIEESDIGAVKKTMQKILAVMKSDGATEMEPMLNLYAQFNEGKLLVLLFPRQKNRPDLYYLEGTEQVLISPGSVEMGGLLVTPIERDFRRLNPEIIRHIYREVSVHPVLLKKWTHQLSLTKD
jgi:hypothetical protein